MTRFCLNSPKPRTCAKPPVHAARNGIAAAEIMLFGVRVAVDSMRKSVSLNNLSQYVHAQDGGGANGGGGDAPSAAAAASGYASADDGVLNSSAAITARERKRGIPWTEDEHKLFLLGLHKVGKGDWRGISRNFVKTRTPTQVASHAQKYFLRRSNLNRRRRRSSLFDITTDAICPMDGYGEQIQPRSIFSLPESCIAGSFQAGFPGLTENPAKSLTLGQGDHQATNDATSSQKFVRPIPILPGERRSMAVDFDLNQESTAEPAPPSPKLFLLYDLNRSAASSFSGGDCSSGSIISVA